MRFLWMAGWVLILLMAACSTSDPAQDGPSDDPDADRYVMAADYSAEHRGDAVLVWEAGEVVFERYQNGYDAGRPHILASGTKTFSGAMALAAVNDGLFALDDRVAQFIPAWEEDPQKAQITIRQLLHLTAGLDTQVGTAPTFDAAIAQPIVHAPGEGFRYGPAAFQVFGALVQRALDGEDPVAYLQRRILTPIGAEVGGWTYVEQRDPQLAGGARFTARNWLRFGRLLLQDGRWAGEAVLPADALEALATPTAASPGYGLTVWLNTAVDPDAPFFEHAPRSLQPDGPDGMIYNDGPRDLFMAAGLFNQRLYVIPSRETVVVRFGRADATWSDAAFLARLLDGRTYEGVPLAALQAEDIRAMARVRLTQLDAALDLTDAQADALRPILVEQMEDVAALQQKRREQAPLSRRQRRRWIRQLAALQQRTDRAVEAVLTSAQIEPYRALRAQEREKWLQR